MKAWLSFPLLALVLVLGLGCPGQTHDTTPITNSIRSTPSQLLLRPNGAAQALKAQVIQGPDGTIYPIVQWAGPDPGYPGNGGSFRWEILGAPAGIDAGRFVLLDSGSINDAIPARLIDLDEALLQSYVPPTALPTGTTRLELKIRVTITPPRPEADGGIAQGEIPLVIDVNAPPTKPSADQPQDHNTGSAR